MNRALYLVSRSSRNTKSMKKNQKRLLLEDKKKRRTPEVLYANALNGLPALITAAVFVLLLVVLVGSCF